MSSSTIGGEIIDRTLELLREWGWDVGIQKLNAEIADADSEGGDERAASLLFTGWMAGERGSHEVALKQMRSLEQLPHLKAWGLVGQAFVMLRKNNYKKTHKLLDEAQTNAKDPILLASIAHCRGSVYHHQGRNKDALEALRVALKGFGRNHFCTGRVLDAIGMVYSSKNQFHAALELYLLALKYKERHGDDAGRAVTQGQLGRLYLDFERFDEAEEYFQNDLNLSRVMGDIRGQALLYNALARISIRKADWDKAIYELGQSLQLSEGRGWSIIEGFARKDLARAFLGQRNTRGAAREIGKARALFQADHFIEGLAHLNQVEGILFRMQKKFALSLQCLRDAWSYFEQHEEPGEAARTEFEIARTCVARDGKLAIRSLKEALDTAEKTQRDGLVGEIGRELKALDELEYYRRIYQRARGRDVTAGTDSLFSGKAETLSVLFLDVQGSTEYAKDLEAEAVMMTMNVMNAHFVDVLRQYQVSVSAYRGDGFMAVSRGRDHAWRAVTAALDMVQALSDFNWPPSLIREYEDPHAATDMKPLSVRIGIATGDAFVGNVGTYDKMDYTALGTTCNLGARLEAAAEPLIPCISQGTYERVRKLFVFSPASPRALKPKGLEDLNVQAWDVVGSKR